MTFDDVEWLLKNQRWIFAKTMPENPHEYTLRKEWEAEEDFVSVVTYMRAHGYLSYFKGRAYTQLNANGHFHWTMGSPLPATILINRKPLPSDVPYDAIAPVYDNLFADQQSVDEDNDVINLIGDLSKKSVLDVGCGTGLLLDYTKPAQYTGVDPSSAMLSQLLRKHRARVVCSTLRAFPEQRRYDKVIALFGAASYLDDVELRRIPKLCSDEYFLMFYAPGYEPETYRKTGTRVPHVTYQDYPPGEVTRYHNYVIVRGRGEYAPRRI